MKPRSDIADQTIEYYDRNSEKFFSETVIVDMSEIYTLFLELIFEGGKILDAGCGSGRDSLYFAQKGFNVTAFDASEEMVRKASELTGLNIIQKRFDEIDWTEKFDGIWACASLLHLPKNQLGNIFETLIKSLKTGGAIYASFKEGTGEAKENGRFFSYYSEAELKNVLKNCGANEVVNCWTSNDVRRNNQQQRWINLLIKRS